MSNLSYCRFANTLEALSDCYENMDDVLSDEEYMARKKMIELCIDIAGDYEWMIEDDE